MVQGICSIFTARSLRLRQLVLLTDLSDPLGFGNPFFIAFGSVHRDAGRNEKIACVTVFDRENIHGLAQRFVIPYQNNFHSISPISYYLIFSATNGMRAKWRARLMAFANRR